LGPTLSPGAYTDAITVFSRESASLDESIAAIRAGKLLDGLVARNPGEEMGWFWNIQELPELPHAGHLVQVLAQHDSRKRSRTIANLCVPGQEPAAVGDNLGVFGDMLANRRLATSSACPRCVRRKARSTGQARAAA